MSETASVEIVELPSQPCLVIRRAITFDQIGANLGEIFPQVFVYLGTKGQLPTGMPFMRYEAMSENGLTIAAGVPTADVVEGRDDIEADTLPGGRTATALHLGDYAKVGEVWDQLLVVAADYGKSEVVGGWDVYTNDPTQVAPEEVETRIYLPLD